MLSTEATTTGGAHGESDKRIAELWPLIAHTRDISDIRQLGNIPRFIAPFPFGQMRQEPFANVSDMLSYRFCHSLVIAIAQCLQNALMRQWCSAEREIVSLSAKEPYLILNVLQNAA